MPHSSNSPTQLSTSSQTPSSSVVFACKSRRTRRGRRAGSHSQSQSPSGMSSHPHSYTSPGPLQMPHASNAPTQLSTSSQTPSPSASSSQVPPHTPRASSWLPSQSQSPAGMSSHPHSSTSPGPLQMPHASNSLHAVVHVVADAISIDVRVASTSTHPRASYWFQSQSHSPSWRSFASAFVHRARPVAHAARVKSPTQSSTSSQMPSSSDVRVACAAAHAEGVELVPLAIAVSCWNVFAPAFIDLARPVADATGVERSDAVVHVVADAIASTSALQAPPHTPKASSWFPIAIAISVWNVCRIHIRRSRQVRCRCRRRPRLRRSRPRRRRRHLHLRLRCKSRRTRQGVELVSLAIAISSWNVIASAFVDLARSVANAAGVERSDAVVHVVADAIFIRVCCASPAAHTEGVELVSVAIAISGMECLSHPHA